MGFTTAAFIRRNTPELRKKLEELGYNHPTDVIEDERFCIATSSANCNYHIIIKGAFDDTNPHHTWNCAGRIDCGANEELFLAIAALRDDTDKNQWFTDGNLWLKCGDEICDETIEYYLNRYNRKYHKATVEELIEHFKEKGGESWIAYRHKPFLSKGMTMLWHILIFVMEIYAFLL